MKKIITFTLIIIILGVGVFLLKPFVNARLDDYKRKETLNNIQRFVNEVESSSNYIDGTYDISQIDINNFSSNIPKSGTFKISSNKVISFNFTENDYNINFDSSDMTQPEAILIK